MHSIEPGEVLEIRGVMKVGPDQYNPTSQVLAIDGSSVAELARECFGNLACKGVMVQLVIKRTDPC